MNTVVVAAMTTTVNVSTRNGTSPITLFLPAGEPMDVEGSVLGFQIMTVDKMRLEKLAGCISPEQQLQVDKIIRMSFGLGSSSPAPAYAPKLPVPGPPRRVI
jgi:mRNA-degrading endonuclease toxin of MazEF toxin-antitoxin module